jgi:hypothetical protein
MPNLVCSKSSCTEVAAFRPVLVLAFEGSAVGYRIRLDVQVCDQHRRELRRTFRAPRGRVLVERALKDRSRGRPDWPRCRLWFERIQ